MQLKVTVNRLNKRMRIPEQLPEATGIIGQVLMGYTFEGVEVPASEIKNPVLGKWYVDRDGYYYWGGGVIEIGVQVATERPVKKAGPPSKTNSYFAQLNELVDWNERVSQIPDEWKASKGAGVKIAVVDTGVYSEHEDLKGAVSFFQDFTVIKDNIDYDGHGTHVLGLIGARSSTINGIIGVAPLSEIIALKVLPDGKDGGDLDNYQSIIDALDAAMANNVDIINMSLSLTVGANPAEDEKKKVNGLRNKIKEITDKNIIITAAAGDNANLRKKKLFFPSDCDGVISIASINQGYFERNPDFSDKLNIAGPTINYISTFKDPLFYERFGGCSMTTAFISGIIALIISNKRMNNPNRFSKAEILDFLKEHSLRLEELNYNDNTKFYYHTME